VQKKQDTQIKLVKVELLVHLRYDFCPLLGPQLIKSVEPIFLWLRL
jgi:hypothetical protein